MRRPHRPSCAEGYQDDFRYRHPVRIPEPWPVCWLLSPIVRRIPVGDAPPSCSDCYFARGRTHVRRQRNCVYSVGRRIRHVCARRRRHNANWVGRGAALSGRGSGISMFANGSVCCCLRGGCVNSGEPESWLVLAMSGMLGYFAPFLAGTLFSACNGNQCWDRYAPGESNVGMESRDSSRTNGPPGIDRLQFAGDCGGSHRKRRKESTEVGAGDRDLHLYLLLDSP